MSTSTLVKEDDEFLYLYKYMHDEPDESAEWHFEGREPKGSGPYGTNWPEPIITADNYATYEIRVDYRIRKSDGKVFFDGVS